MTGKLYVTGTPIGNLSDFSPRAKQTLETVDFIAAEDTRVTLKLLNHFGIKKEMVSCHEHNIRQRCEYIVGRLLQGESCAIVTDAGMPCISDPGEELVKLCHEQGIPVLSVPGPSALISALSISGQDTSCFCFEGFLTVNRKNRMARLEEIKHLRRTLIFYEAPHKLRATLRDLYEALGDRSVSLVREITKIHEECVVTTLSQAAAYYRSREAKGEYVLVVAGASQPVEQETTLQDAIALAKRLQQEQSLSPSEAAKQAGAQTPFKRSDIYKGLQQSEE